jgi:hypothetical protein
LLSRAIKDRAQIKNLRHMLRKLSAISGQQTGLRDANRAQGAILPYI